MCRLIRTRTPGSTLAVALVLAAAGCRGPEAVPEELPSSLEAGTIHLTDAQIESAGLRWSAVTPQPMRQTVRVPGSVIPPDTSQASVGSIVEGRVARVLVLPGDRVRAGQTLVEIHSHELSDAQAAYATARATLEYQSQAIQRAERLFKVGAVSLEEVQRRRSEMGGAEAEMERAAEMVEHLHPTPGGNVTAQAPRDGVVFSVDARPGQVVVPGAPLVSMGGTDVLWVTAFVPEGTSANLEAGDEVDVEFRAPPGTAARARLVRMGQYVEPGSRSVEVRFELLSIPQGVRPGSFATVNISTAGAFQGVELPEEAAVRMGDQDVVFVATGPGLFRVQVVEVVPIRPGLVALRGLSEGAQVVTQGAYFLKSVLEAEEEAVGGETS